MRTGWNQILKAVLTAAVLASCAPGGDDGKSSSSSGSSCTAGSKGCECMDGTTCDGELSCVSGTCTEVECTPGHVDCACLDGMCTEAESICGSDGLCQRVSCQAGSEGCRCGTNDRCGINTRGQQLSCMEGTCVVAECPPGGTGCLCRPQSAGTERCSTDGDECRDGFCRPGGCVPGDLNCECAGGACNGANLTCQNGSICVDNTGLPGGPCYDTGRCNPGNRCQAGSCLPCVPGSLHCTCGSGDSCNQGLACQSGECIEDTGPRVPDNPVCYTPCEQGLPDADGTYRSCPADGLMQGCIGDNVCTEGSCVAAGEAVPTCADDLECPDYQACIQGKCYSNCESDAQCGGGQRCFRHVCRTPCETASPTCPTGQYCKTTTPDDGYCALTPPASGEPQTQVEGGFVVSEEVLTFSNIKTSASFRITNNSPAYHTFKVRKRSHFVNYADTTHDEVDAPDANAQCAAPNCPLYWLKLGEFGSTTPVQDFTIGVEANSSVVIEVTGAGDTEGVRWNGSLEVLGGKLGERTVRLSYVERPEGQWAGSMYFFATFGDRDLEQWRTGDRNDVNLQRAVGNALVQRWGAFRRGQISWDEFQAVLMATRSESWRWPSVQDACDTAACYLYDGNVAGLESYTSNLDGVPIPTGITELPIVMNLRQPDAELAPNDLAGRIESTRALQYAGNPAITLQFADNPTSCSVTAHNTCITFIQDFETKIYVGGRFVAQPGDNDCSLGFPGGGYEPRPLPWLVPGFVRDTVLNTDGTRARVECRDPGLPFVSANPDEAARLKPLNIALSGSNPVPDGRARQRTLRLVDGALINQSQIFLLFEESFESFMDVSDAGGFKAYGYMVLERAKADLSTEDADNDTVPDAFEGSEFTGTRMDPQGLLAPVCDPTLLASILPPNTQLDATTAPAQADRVVQALIEGLIPGGTGTSFIAAGSTEEAVHYLCRDTGLIDGGANSVTPPGITTGINNDNHCRLELVAPNCNSCTATDRVCVSGQCYIKQDASANNGQCDDGGPDSVTSVCDFGRDAADCGTRYTADRDERVACPAGSEVVFFTVDPDLMSQQDIADLPCQQDNSCADLFYNRWTNGAPLVQREVLWRCEDSTSVYCDDDRYDLRSGKKFYARTETRARFVPLATQIDQAFRYKTRFRSRSGQTVGFAPTICQPNSELAPYCYDPAIIEETRGRVDCLMHVWSNYYQHLSTQSGNNVQALLNNYLDVNFSYDEVLPPTGGLPLIYDGFERLYAELLIMLGDESFTASFASRFDLAGSRAVSFEGSKFEENGINLAGVAGYEMFSLYQSAQYYQEALDRFYEMSPLIWRALAHGTDDRNFVSIKTVTWYFDKLVRASTQKSRALSEISRKYQGFNRPDLARRVVERAYTGTYMESIVMARLMQKVVEVSRAEDRAQLRKAVEDAQRRYRVAMLEMRSVYDAITDRTTFFGLTPDYVPLPALDYMQPNAFEVVAARALEKTRVAREREDLALSAGRSFDTDAAQFQAELTRIRNTYDNQLGDLCGTFIGPEDGRVYPAIDKYAQLHPRAKTLGTPCGMMGSGAIHEAMGQMEVLQLDMQSVHVSMDNLFTEVAIEEQRVREQCNLIEETATFVYNQSGQVKELREEMGYTRAGIAALDRMMSTVSTVAQLSKCNVGVATDCPTGITAMGVFLGVASVAEVAAAGLEFYMVSKEKEIAEIERNTARWQTQSQCDAALIDSNARTATMLLRLKELELEQLRVQRRIDVALSDIREKYNQAIRLQLEQQEAEQLQINVEAARNDPNVRIYKNDAVINADIAFYDAAREAYRATKIYEYYTSQTYAAQEKLFLVRMVARGDYNLENYLTELRNAFNDFEEQYGNPDTRVLEVSLLNDILRIPRVDENQRGIDEGVRIALMREKLADPAMLDSSGYLSLPFSTVLDALSPLTRNHKVNFIEAELSGSLGGDLVARLYLVQEGTGVVRSVDDEKRFYRLPERTAVLNPFFGGARYYAPEIYRNYRLRDRPLVNTSWRLVINQRDETANQDMNLQGLSDIKLFIYYTDFTRL